MERFHEKFDETGTAATQRPSWIDFELLIDRVHSSREMIPYLAWQHCARPSLSSAWVPRRDAINNDARSEIYFGELLGRRTSGTENHGIQTRLLQVFGLNMKVMYTQCCSSARWYSSRSEVIINIETKRLKQLSGLWRWLAKRYRKCHRSF